MKRLIIVISSLLVFFLLTVTVCAAYQNFYVAGSICIAQLTKYPGKAMASTTGATPNFYCYAQVTLSYFCGGKFKQTTQSQGSYREVYVTAVAPCSTGALQAYSTHRCYSPDGQNNEVNLSE